MPDIRVGDVIWIIDSDRHTIIPARVNEQIVSKTVSGEQTYHHVEFPSGKRQKLENVTAVWYDNLAGVRAHLLQRASELIEKTVTSAKEIALQKFQVNAEEEGESPNDQVDLSEEALLTSTDHTDSLRVALDSGQIVNVKVPQEFLDENFSG